MDSDFDCTIDCETGSEFLKLKELIDPLIENPIDEFFKTNHRNYLLKALTRTYGPDYVAFDVIRPWLCFWTFHSLELLDPLDELDSELIESAVYTIGRYQTAEGGFGGKPGIIPHLACTYASLATICMLERGYEMVNRGKLREYLLRMKRDDGSFSVYETGENDVRGIYCALASAAFTGLLDEQLVRGCAEQIARCQSRMEGGFGSHPNCEAHGGYTYCAVAALKIISRVQPGCFDLVDVPRLLEYCVRRQCRYSGGINGRTNKLVDGCYSFWIPAAMAIVCEATGTHEAVSKFDARALETFLLSVCQNRKSGGGFRDKPGKGEDLYHTCYCLSGLSIIQNNSLFAQANWAGHTSLQSIDPTFNVQAGKFERMHSYFEDK